MLTVNQLTTGGHHRVAYMLHTLNQWGTVKLLKQPAHSFWNHDPSFIPQLRTRILFHTAHKRNDEPAMMSQHQALNSTAGVELGCLMTCFQYHLVVFWQWFCYGWCSHFTAPLWTFTLWDGVSIFTELHAGCILKLEINWPQRTINFNPSYQTTCILNF